jgi:hypothetical protein
MMEWEKEISILSLSHKVRLRGRMLGWSPPSWPNGQFGPLNRALIGGAQPNHGWWPPIAQRYKEEGGGRGTRYEVHRSRHKPTYIPNPNPILEGSADATRSSATTSQGRRRYESRAADVHASPTTVAPTSPLHRHLVPSTPSPWRALPPSPPTVCTYTPL